MKISVLGLGYIGLPTALLLAKAGNNVIGVDTNKKIVDILNKGKLPFEEPGIITLFQQAKKKFTAHSILKSSDVYIIAVPTPLEKGMKLAELGAVQHAAESIAKVIKEGQLVILESTVPPGTSETFVLPILQKNFKKSFYYAHCPERAIPGKTLHEMIFNDRVIGALDEESAIKTKQLYSSFVKGKLYLTNTTTAEYVKLMENTFRDINIALANEFSLMAEEFGIDVWKAIEIANRHPRVDILKPGPGVGGHCIAIDPLFLAEKSSRSRIVSLAREINDSMPGHVVKLVKNMLRGIENPTITLFGLAYKGNVDDTRESPAFKIKKIAEGEGFSVRYFDPFVKNFPHNCKTLTDAVKKADCIVLITDHDIFKTVDPKSLKMRNKNLLDTRNILNHNLWRDAGFRVKILGIE